MAFVAQRFQICLSLRFKEPTIFCSSPIWVIKMKEHSPRSFLNHPSYKRRLVWGFLLSLFPISFFGRRGGACWLFFWRFGEASLNLYIGNAGLDPEVWLLVSLDVSLSLWLGPWAGAALEALTREWPRGPLFGVEFPHLPSWLRWMEAWV